MRALVIAAVIGVPAAAHAESFLEILGGVSIPIADNNWTNTAESSPKLDTRVGAVNESGLGAMLLLDWTPVNLDNPGGQIISGAMHRFRILANLAIQKPVGTPKLSASFRAGIGIDINHESISSSIGGFNSTASDTDTGFAFELGGGLWYDIGSAQLGAELALPIGHHSKQGNVFQDGNFTFDWTSYDIDILFGVRLVSH